MAAKKVKSGGKKTPAQMLRDRNNGKIPRKPARKGGKKTKVLEVTDKFIEIFKMGLPIRRCCKFVAIDTKTYYNWMEWGEKGDPKYKGFYDSVMKIQAEREAKLLKDIKDAPPQTWQAKRYLLQLMDPDIYTDKSIVQHEGGDPEKPVSHDVNLSPSSIKEIAQSIIYANDKPNGDK